MFRIILMYLSIADVFASQQRITLNGRDFVDEDGRQRVFHGVNAVVKVFPWIPSRGEFDSNYSLGPKDILNLRSWGFNVVRLGVMWPGVEIGPRVYNYTYLNEMVKLVNDLGDAGIYTIVDMHQDLGSRYYCGEGFPEFYIEALESDPNSSLAQGRDFPIGPFSKDAYVIPDGQTYPSLDDCLSKVFSEYYFTDKVGRLFETLYTPGTAMNDGFIDVWREIASAFKNNPNVLAYELLNEPWFGDVLSDPSLVISKVTDRDLLQPLYIAAADSIRSVDNETGIMYQEPAFTPRLPGFTAPPTNDGRSIFSYHIYCIGGTGLRFCDKVEDIFELKFQYWLKKNGYGAFMTEFGAIDNNTVSIQEYSFLLDQADKYIQSWSYWQFKLFGDITGNPLESLYTADGTLETNKVKLLTRTYARAVAGDITGTHFNTLTHKFTLTFTPSASTSGISELYTSSLWYPNGVTITVDNSCVTYTKPDVNGYIFLNSTSCNGVEVKVVVS